MKNKTLSIFSPKHPIDPLAGGSLRHKHVGAANRMGGNGEWVTWLTCLFVVCLTVRSLALTVVCPGDASPMMRLAAREVQRYVYLRTGEKPAIADSGEGMVLRIDPTLGREAYRLRTVAKLPEIIGGSDLGVLYGAYRYAEMLGVRFYLHGDVIPDERLRELPVVNDDGKPFFDIRGINPFHDFQEGPDWWNQDDYLAYVAQLAKMRMNFIGLHCYPESDAGPEPLVWIGRPDDLTADGKVSFSYPAEWASTERRGMWGYASMKTSDYAGGASLLFPTDVYAPDVMEGMVPRPVTPEQSNELFNRVGAQMGKVFSQARQLGVKTCIGTETPLTIPALVKGRSTDARTLYTGMFKRIAQVSPVDYYWLWTPEGWTWSGNDTAQLNATKRDIEAALGALHDLGNPFTLATSGWVLGPANDRAALDELLPKSSPMSCINRNVGHEGVEPAFANVTGRPKWAIPWMENDPNMVGPQPWAARMRYDAVDARRFGCTGLLGIHWRTKAMQMNVAALAAAAWNQSWVPEGFDVGPVKPSKGTEGAHGGSVAAFTQPVEGTATPKIYQDVRYNMNRYLLGVPNGRYKVILQFNEPFYQEAGKRVFGVKIQGKQVIHGLDVFSRVGQNKALDLSYDDMVVSDGMLDIGFTNEIEFPCIAAIMVSGKTAAANQLASQPFERKINCGGSPVGDYEADKAGAPGIAPAGPDRVMPVEDFYVDFARANFGTEVATAAGKLLASIDGRAMVEVSGWHGGPGGFAGNPAPWDAVRPRFAFVETFAAMRDQVHGAGNLERFDYWLSTYRGQMAMAQADCLRGQLDREMAAKDYVRALATRIELANVWTRLLRFQTAIVSTPGELGTIANLEQHSRKQLRRLDGHDAALEQALGKPLPPEVQPGKDYQGPARIIVPTVRSLAERGETLKIRFILLDKQPMVNPVFKYRSLGDGAWRTAPVKHLGRAVYSAELPPIHESLEYYVSAQTSSGSTLVWPPTAPAVNQTVVTSD